LSFDADSDQDPNFHFDADPDPDWHQNNADPHADPTPSFTNFGKSHFFYFLSLYNVKCAIRHSVFGQHIEISRKKSTLSIFSFAWN
jgi:hypothetical protein